MAAQWWQHFPDPFAISCGHMSKFITVEEMGAPLGMEALSQRVSSLIILSSLFITGRNPDMSMTSLSHADPDTSGRGGGCGATR